MLVILLQTILTMINYNMLLNSGALDDLKDEIDAANDEVDKSTLDYQ